MILINPYRFVQQGYELWPKPSCADTPDSSVLALREAFYELDEESGSPANTGTASSGAPSLIMGGGASWSGKRVYLNGTSSSYLALPSANSYIWDRANGFTSFFLVASSNADWYGDGGSGGTAQGTAFLVGDKSTSGIQVETGTSGWIKLEGGGTGLNVSTSSLGIWDGNPHKILVIVPWDSGYSAEIWVDGVLRASGASTGARASFSEIRVGRNDQAWWEEFRGYIYSFQIHNQATSQQIREAFFSDPYGCEAI